MKKIKLIFVLLTFLLVSCKLENKKLAGNNQHSNETKIINDLPIGVNLLLDPELPEDVDYENSSDNLIDSISYLSNVFYESLTIHKNIVFNQLPQIKEDIIYNNRNENGMIYYLDSCYYAKTIFDNGNLQLKLFKNGESFKEKLGEENNSITHYLILATYNNLNNLIDFKVIYFNETMYYANNSMYFFLDTDMSLYLNTYQTEEEGIQLISKYIYNINKQGNFILESKYITKKEPVIKESKEGNNDDWNGIYQFEASNKDDLKTIINIHIEALNHVSLQIDEEGAIQKYSDLKAESIANNTIKIEYPNNFNNEEIETLFIERFGDDFYISGQPIYFINPGNDHLPLKKVR